MLFSGKRRRVWSTTRWKAGQPQLCLSPTLLLLDRLADVRLSIFSYISVFVLFVWLLFVLLPDILFNLVLICLCRLDADLGGGLPSGCITELIGAPGSGKTQV